MGHGTWFRDGQTAPPVFLAEHDRQPLAREEGGVLRAQELVLRMQVCGFGSCHLELRVWGSEGQGVRA